MDQQRLKDTIADAQDGSPEAFGALLDAYWPRLYGYFLRAVGRHHDAEDLLGDLALKLVRRLKHYDDRGRFDHWLFRIAANMVRDRIRRLKVRPYVASLSADRDNGGSMADNLDGPAEPVDSRLLAAEVSGRLGRALEKIEPVTREVILLRHFGELSFKEIAEICSCPIGTALARVHRGLKRLRSLMEEDEEHATE